MIKHFLCKIIGDGASLQTAYRPEIKDLLAGRGGYSALIPNNPNGTPKKDWCYVVVEASEAVLLELENVHGLPPVMAGKETKVNAFLFARGVPPNISTDKRGICDLLEPGVDITQCRINGKHE